MTVTELRDKLTDVEEENLGMLKVMCAGAEITDIKVLVTAENTVVLVLE